MKPHLTAGQIVAFRDGESTNPDEARHLDACEPCRQKLQESQRLANLLKTAQGPVQRVRMRADLTLLRHERSSATVESTSLSTPSPPGLPPPLTHQSRSIGLLHVHQGSGNVTFRYSPLEIDRSFLDSPVQTFAASAVLDVERPPVQQIAQRMARLRTPTVPFAFSGGKFRFTVEGNGESANGLRIGVGLRSDDKVVARAGLEVTLIDSENAPRTFTTNEEGLVQLDLRSMRSILLLHTEASHHLGIELSK